MTSVRRIEMNMSGAACASSRKKIQKTANEEHSRP